jgi:hypothetical protein
MCESLMRNGKNKEVFKEHFMKILVGLADDKVVNVKLVLAEIVQKHMGEKGPLSEEEEFVQLRDKLANDPNEEIKVIF